jgi:hypothetical protein
MRNFTTCLIILLSLTVFFGIKDLTVENVAKSIVDKGWGTVMLWLGGGGNVAQQNRQLPPNQGDDSELIKPIEELEDIK